MSVIEIKPSKKKSIKLNVSSIYSLVSWNHIMCNICFSFNSLKSTLLSNIWKFFFTFEMLSNVRSETKKKKTTFSLSVGDWNVLFFKISKGKAKIANSMYVRSFHCIWQSVSLWYHESLSNESLHIVWCNIVKWFFECYGVVVVVFYFFHWHKRFKSEEYLMFTCICAIES